MKRVYKELGWFSLRGLVWLLWAPVSFGVSAVRFWVLRHALDESIRCGTCRAQISLLGLWECGGCRYAWYGWYFARCEVCGDVPPWVECWRCGASTMNPLFFGQRMRP